MAINFPGPYEVRINYSTVHSSVLLQHQMRFSMDMNVAADPGDPFDDWTLQSRQGATPQLDAWVDELIGLLEPMYHSTSDFIDAELWEYSPGTFDAEFRSSYAIGEVGSSGSGTQPAGQLIITYRTLGGGSGRVTLMESVSAAGPTQTFPLGAGNSANLAAFFTEADSPVIGRDNTYFFAPVGFHPGQNEALFKRRFR